jgi:hypothetical protein
MEAVKRTPYQGVFNIVRFNWHFYIAAAVLVITLFAVAPLLDNLRCWLCISIAIATITSTLVSLFVSHYIYDRSDLYDFHWLRQNNNLKSQCIVNLHAGFDETSTILRNTFPKSNLVVLDFYDPSKHTELSIERARKTYGPFEGTIKTATGKLSIAADSTDMIFNIFALHEVRSRKERVHFLKQQADALKNEGRIFVVEHLRDIPNFLAFNIGFFHFFSRREWLDNFSRAELTTERKFKITPFITAFILKKIDGNTP